MFIFFFSFQKEENKKKLYAKEYLSKYTYFPSGVENPN